MAKKKLSAAEFRQLLGKEIKRQREAAGHTTYAFATLIEKPQPRVIEIEKGAIKELDTYYRCLQLLGGRLEIKWN